MFRVCCIACVFVGGFVASLANDSQAADPAPGVDAKAYEQAVSRAIGYLQSKGQAEDGSYSKQTGPAVTSLITAAVIRSGRSLEDPLVAKSLKFIEGFVQPDGSISQAESNYRNYETCMAIMCLKEANKDGRYDKQLKNAEKFIKDIQWDEKEGHDLASFSYGGAGYGSKKRPDLSNTGFLIDALKATGNGPDDEAMKKALVFVSRCPNLETANNTGPFAAKVNDGGFYYTIAAGGASFAGNTEDGGLRSYGSMTYAGLKSMIFAGVKADDPRVKAATTWIQKHYTLQANPGMEDAGLYYYYHTFAKALAAIGQDAFVDDKGVPHNWRRELVDELAKRQQPDGSWINPNNRWMEGDPNLVTGYALMTLTYCKPTK